MATTTTATALTSASTLSAIAKNQTYIGVRIALLVESLIFGGLTALFVAWNYATIEWEMLGFVSIVPQMIIAAIAAGFVSGLMTRHKQKCTYPSWALVIVVLAVLGALNIVAAILDSSIDELEPLGFYVQIMPTVSHNAFWNTILWYLPAIVLMPTAVPISNLGGFIARKFIKVKPGVALSSKEQIEKILDVFKKPLFVLIFVVCWIPFLLPLFSIDDSVHKEYSAWNVGSSGISQFRADIEASGHPTMSSITSYSLLSRIEDPFVLVVMGPNRFYNIVSDLPFMMKFMRQGGAMLVADDHGSTEWLFTNMLLASTIVDAGNMFPITFFMDGILRDNASYYNTNDFPLIQSSNIASHAITTGVSQLILNRASGLMFLPGMEGLFGWNVVATSTSGYSWVDKDDNGMYSRDIDSYDPYQANVGGLLFTVLKQYGISFPRGLPQGGNPIPLIATKEFGPGLINRIVVTADASMFTNQLFDRPDICNNAIFAMNCIDWLSGGNRSMLVVFDESHLSPVAIQDTSAPALYGQVLDYVSFMSSNWMTAPIYPFIAITTLKRWLPKSEEQKRKEQAKKQKKINRATKRQQTLDKQERRQIGRQLFSRKGAKPQGTGAAPQGKGKKQKTFAQKRAETKLQGILKKSTFFAQKLAWYMEQSEFNSAVELLYNRIKRLAGKKVGGDKTTNEQIIDAITEKFPQVEQKKLQSFFKKMDRIVLKGPSRLKVTRVEGFENLYYEIVTIGEYLEKL
jgi:hypothetical protein